MSLPNVADFQASAVFTNIAAALTQAPATTRQALVKKVNAIYQINVTNPAKQTHTWSLNLKDTATDGAIVGDGPPSGKPGVIVTVGDADLVAMSEGKLQGQAAFMKGKIKLRGNMMLATKLDTLFKTVQELAAKSPSVSSAPAPASTSAPKADAGVAVDGFESSALFVQLAHAFATMAPAERKRAVQGVRGVFQFNIRNAAGQTQTWALDLKNTAESGEVVARGAPAKADIILTVADADFVSIGQGKTSAQGAFLTGKLKLKGNMALAMKLEPVLKAARPKASL